MGPTAVRSWAVLGNWGWGDAVWLWEGVCGPWELVCVEICGRELAGVKQH